MSARLAALLATLAALVGRVKSAAGRVPEYVAAVSQAVARAKKTVSGTSAALAALTAQGLVTGSEAHLIAGAAGIIAVALGIHLPGRKAPLTITLAEHANMLASFAKNLRAGIELSTPPPYDPSRHSVPVVVHYLDQSTADERTHVLAAERAGKKRKGILAAKLPATS